MTGVTKRIKLRATIMVDIDAVDYLDAANIQKAVEQLTQELGDQYSGATYDLRERRDRGAATEPEPEPVKTKRVRKPKKVDPKPDDTELEIGEAG